MLLQLLADVTNELPPARDYVTTGGAVIMALLSTIGGVLIALIQSNRRLTKRGMKAAEVAAERSEPTGNGFAGEVRATLRRIEGVQHEQSRDIGGIREEIRQERIERITLARAVSNYMERHPA